MKLTIDIPNTQIQHLGKSEKDLLLSLAIFMYSEWKMSSSRCARMADLPRVVFLNELAKRGVPINYDVEDLEQDVKNWENFKLKHDNNKRHDLP